MSYLANPNQAASGSGITSINAMTGSAQIITSGSSGSDVNVSSVGDTTTINVPSASSTARGVITTGAQTLAGVKTFSSQPAVPSMKVNTVDYLSGAGSPEGVITAVIGSFYTDSINGVVFVKNTGVGNTGWVQIPIASGSGITRVIASISTPTTAGSVASTDYVYLVSGTTTLTLPTAIGNTNRYSVKNVGVSTVQIATSLSQTIDGNTTVQLATQYEAVDIISDGANWNIL